MLEPSKAIKWWSLIRLMGRSGQPLMELPSALLIEDWLLSTTLSLDELTTSKWPLSTSMELAITRQRQSSTPAFFPLVSKLLLGTPQQPVVSLFSGRLRVIWEDARSLVMPSLKMMAQVLSLLARQTRPTIQISETSLVLTKLPSL